MVRKNLLARGWLLRVGDGAICISGSPKYARRSETISRRRIYLRRVSRRSACSFSPLVNGKGTPSDRNHDERDHHVFEQRRFGLLDDPPPVVNRKRSLDRKAYKSCHADVEVMGISPWRIRDQRALARL